MREQDDLSEGWDELGDDRFHVPVDLSEASKGDPSLPEESFDVESRVVVDAYFFDFRWDDNGEHLCVVLENPIPLDRHADGFAGKNASVQTVDPHSAQAAGTSQQGDIDLSVLFLVIEPVEDRQRVTIGRSDVSSLKRLELVDLSFVSIGQPFQIPLTLASSHQILIGGSEDRELSTDSGVIGMHPPFMVMFRQLVDEVVQGGTHLSTNVPDFDPPSLLNVGSENWRLGYFETSNDGTLLGFSVDLKIEWTLNQGTVEPSRESGRVPPVLPPGFPENRRVGVPRR